MASYEYVKIREDMLEYLDDETIVKIFNKYFGQEDRSDYLSIGDKEDNKKVLGGHLYEDESYALPAVRAIERAYKKIKP